MGMIFSSSTKIYKIDVYKSASGDDQTVVYSTTESKTFTLRAVVGVQTAHFSLMDYTCTSLGTGVDIMVHHQPGIFGGMGILNFRHRGDILHVQNDADNVTIRYGIERYNVGLFSAKKFLTHTGGVGLMVAHGLWSSSDICAVLFIVSYDAGKGCFMCELIGPFRRTSIAEIMVDVEYSCRHISSSSASSTGGHQSAITGLINNLGERVSGKFNGSINNFINNFYSNSK